MSSNAWAVDTNSSQYYCNNPNSQKSEARSVPSWSNNNHHTLSPKSEDREATSNLTMSPISPSARSPPTSPGPSNIMNLDPFSQLSLGSMYGNNNNNQTNANNFGASNGNSGVASPPKSPVQQNNHATNSIPGMPNNYHSQPQPMVVSPDHAAGALVPAQQQAPAYDPFQNQFNAAPVMNQQAMHQPYAQQQQLMQSNFQQPQFQQQPAQHLQQQNAYVPQQQSEYNPQQMVTATVPANQGQAYSNYTYNNGANNNVPNMPPSNDSALAAFSPPVSPLWAPASPQANQQAQNANHAVPFAGPAPPSLPSGNPFDEMFGSTNNQVAAPAPANANVAPVASGPTNTDEADFWADMGFGNTAPSNNTTNNATTVPDSASSNGSYEEPTQEEPAAPLELDSRGLPSKGEYYQARISTQMLGAIFSSARELRSTLFSAASEQIVNAIGDRPVVSFTIDGSAADTAGIQLGHVLLKVNDNEVHKTEDAVRLIGQSPRPLKMEYYIPPEEMKVVKSEAQCLVKYDTNSTDAPATCVEWKPKYVVVGDMLGKPHIIYMYRSKVSVDR